MANEIGTLLIVDDNMNNIQVLAGILTNNGYNVEFATNGENALNWIEEEHFDLILLDIMMPQMDGYEVCERIRKTGKAKDLPVIFLTAKTDKESIVKAFKKGGNDYLTKPFDQSELLARVNTQLELKKSKDKLAEINDWLEKLVAQRTQELNSALEEVTQLNKKLLQLDEVKSEFLKMISHELRTPLNGILGFTDIIKNTNEAEPLKEFIDLLEQSALRLEKFSLNALLFTSLKLGNYYVEFAAKNVKTILDSAIDKQKVKLKSKSILVEINCHHELSINVDEEIFSNAVLIVLDNAIRFSPENSTIKIDVESNGEHVKISFKDNGTGFSPKALKNLFEFFGAGEQHFDQNLGLGLALSHQILLANKGKIDVKNHEEGGAVVTLSVPCLKHPGN
jgi:two-component system, sensor histidine kinase and response regulator